MEIQELRRKRLREWIDTHHGGVALQFANRVKKPQSQIADMLRGAKSFGEKVARALESSAGMPAGYLDSSDDAQPDAPRRSTSDWPFHRLRPADFAWLDPSQITDIEELVEDRIARFKARSGPRRRRKSLSA